MLGWKIYIFRHVPDQRDADELSTKEVQLAIWQASINGIDWLDELVRQGKAEDLGGDGYPCRYTAVAKDLLPEFSSGPPSHDSPTVIGDDYVHPRGWTGDAEIDHTGIAECPPDEQLFIEAWNSS